MTSDDPQQTRPGPSCACFIAPADFLATEKYLGMDSSFAEVELLVCPLCGQHWLRYFYELEAFTVSGRWYLGAINTQQAAHLKAEEVKSLLENLDWVFFGGSYFGGRTGKRSGKISL